MTRHEMILNQVNQSIQSLSKKIKLRYPKLSWQIKYNQDSDILVRCEECFTMQVGFNDEEMEVLDLNVQLDDDNNLRIDAGLIEDDKVIQQLIDKNSLGDIKELFSGYWSSEDRDGLNSSTRLKALMNFNKSNLKSIQANISDIMRQIEIAFMLVMSELRAV